MMIIAQAVLKDCRNAEIQIPTPVILVAGQSLSLTVLTDVVLTPFSAGITGRTVVEAECMSSIMLWFKRSSTLVLLTTGGAKVWSAFGSAKILGMADPLLGISFQHLIAGAGFIEIGVAILLLSSLNRLAAFALAWLATNFAIYRIGIWWIHWQRPCPCLGNLSDALHISPPTADRIMKIVFGYLLVGSYWLLFRERKLGRSGTLGSQSTGG
jgi:hypothetical protein